MKSKTETLSAQTLIVGIDIAKYTHWARMTDFRGVDLCKPFKVENSTSGFEGLVKKLIELQAKHNLTELIIGMEPSGHYWRALGWFLKTNGIRLVGVNPYHVKQLKELEDNSQSKNDKKDAYIIACLIRDGRFFDMYLPENEYADLRLLNRHRQQLLDTKKKTTNILKAIMDEFFPEYAKNILDINNPTSRKVLMAFPFPSDITKYTQEEFQQKFKQLKVRRISSSKLYEFAKQSIGVTEGLSSCRKRVTHLINILNFYEQLIKECEQEMELIMEKLDLSKYLTSIPGIASVTSAAFVAEIGDPSRFNDWKQLQKLAGLNLTEQSSGLHKGKSKISKRGRPGLRHILFVIADKGVLINPEMRQYYYYLRRRQNNQLAHTQALIAVGLKYLRIMFHVINYKEMYDPDKALGKVRQEQIASLLAA